LELQFHKSCCCWFRCYWNFQTKRINNVTIAADLLKDKATLIYSLVKK
jgi:hypothetical protein